MENNKKNNRLLAFIRQILTPAEAAGIIFVLCGLPIALGAYAYFSDEFEHTSLQPARFLNIVLNKAERTKPESKKILRVAAPFGERVISKLSPYGPGFEHELLGIFANLNRLEVHYQQVDSRQAALELLREGSVDLVLGFPGDLTFEDGEELAAGQAYVSSQAGKVVKTDEETPESGSKVGKTLHSMIQQTDKHSTPQAAPSTEQRQLQPADEESEFIDEHSFKLWQPFRPELKVSFKGATPDNYRWFWRYDDVEFFPLFYSFWDELAKSTQIKELEEKYFGFLPNGSPPWQNLNDLVKIVQENVPDYKKALNKAAKTHKISPLLLIALIYQESRFDPEAQSPTGPLGIMQFTQNTAKHLNVDPLDPVQSIDAGAKYLKMLWDDLEDLDLDYWDRWFFTLAAYNQGPAHLRDAIKLAEQQGKNGHTWRELKTIYPMLSQEKYYSQTKYGYCRGGEAVAFVEKIRYYFYVLNGFSSISRFEGQDLAANRSSDRPRL